MRISDWSSDVCSSDLAQHFALHVVDDAVHAGDGVGRAGELLAVEPERHLAQRVEPLADQLQQDQQVEAAAGVVVGFLAGARAQDRGPQVAALARGEELAGAVTLAFGNLSQPVFFAASETNVSDVMQDTSIERVGEGTKD